MKGLASWVTFEATGNWLSSASSDELRTTGTTPNGCSTQDLRKDTAHVTTGYARGHSLLVRLEQKSEVCSCGFACCACVVRASCMHAPSGGAAVLQGAASQTTPSCAAAGGAQRGRGGDSAVCWRTSPKSSDREEVGDGERDFEPTAIDERAGRTDRSRNGASATLWCSCGGRKMRVETLES
jgi:hypothetical protein